jgi:hypothetical protein
MRARRRPSERPRKRPALGRADRARPGLRFRAAGTARCPDAGRGFRKAGEALGGGIEARVLDFPVCGNELAAERREPRTTPAHTADARRRDRLGERVVEVVEQQPRAPVAHAELAGCL